MWGGFAGEQVADLVVALGDTLLAQAVVLPPLRRWASSATGPYAARRKASLGKRPEAWGGGVSEVGGYRGQAMATLAVKKAAIARNGPAVAMPVLDVPDIHITAKVL